MSYTLELSTQHTLVCLAPSSVLVLEGLWRLHFVHGTACVNGRAVEETAPALLIGTFKTHAPVFVSSWDLPPPLTPVSAAAAPLPCRLPGRDWSGVTAVLIERPLNVPAVYSTALSASTYSIHDLPPPDPAPVQTSPSAPAPPALYSAWLAHARALASASVAVVGVVAAGKSSFARILANTRANSAPTLVVDLDPGQGECCPPGCLRATIVDHALTGPLGNCLNTTFVSVPFGYLSPRENPDHYEACARALAQRLGLLSYSSMVVNCHGWNTGHGATGIAAALAALGVECVAEMQGSDLPPVLPAVACPRVGVPAARSGAGTRLADIKLDSALARDCVLFETLLGAGGAEAAFATEVTESPAISVLRLRSAVAPLSAISIAHPEVEGPVTALAPRLLPASLVFLTTPARAHPALCQAVVGGAARFLLPPQSTLPDGELESVQTVSLAAFPLTTRFFAPSLPGAYALADALTEAGAGAGVVGGRQNMQR